MLPHFRNFNKGPKIITEPRYIFEDDFETASPKAGWTYWNVSNSATSPLAGTRSLRVNSTNNYAFIDFPGQDELWVFAKFYIANYYNYAFQIQGSVGTLIAFGNWGPNNTRYLGQGFDVFPGGELLYQTIKYAWVQYKKGTGSNAIVNVYYANTATRPASPQFTRTNSTSTVQATRLYWGAGSSGLPNQLDTLRISSKEIGDNPI